MRCGHGHERGRLRRCQPIGKLERRSDPDASVIARTTTTRRAPGDHLVQRDKFSIPPIANHGRSPEPTAAAWVSNDAGRGSSRLCRPSMSVPRARSRCPPRRARNRTALARRGPPDHHVIADDQRVRTTPADHPGRGARPGRARRSHIRPIVDRPQLAVPRRMDASTARKRSCPAPRDLFAQLDDVDTAGVGGVRKSSRSPWRAGRRCTDRLRLGKRRGATRG
jgi:hypothetical protein